MCSVVGYLGKSLSKSFVLSALSRLEYRGYDSSGFACITPEDHRLLYLRSVGPLENLNNILQENSMDGFVGIGHTRWSTHGVVSENNAHPQFDCEKSIAVVYNGIIENHLNLRKNLEQQGHVFNSETDSEVIAHLLESFILTHQTLQSALIELVNQLHGAFAFIAISQNDPDQMIVVRRRSPICIGIGENEVFVASDLLAFANKTKKVIFLPDESFAILHKDSIELYDFSGKALTQIVKEIDTKDLRIDKGDFQHFMLKEIYEQKRAINDSVRFYKSISGNIWNHLGLSIDQVQKIKTIHLIGCGTSWHAARIAQFFFESICKISTKIHLASEFRYMNFFADESDLFLAISQSGETADVLEAVTMIRQFDIPVIAVTNVASSTLVRESDGFLLTYAGPEVAVASTKAFSTQLTALFWLANRIALEKSLITQEQFALSEDDLLVAAELLESNIENYKLEIIHKLAPKYAQFKKIIFLGRHITYPFALEAALKLKEISYIFAEGYPAGELKHGPIALIDAETPVFMFSSLDENIYLKLLANAQEIKSRNGHLVVFAFQGQDELCSIADYYITVPEVNPLLGPLVMTGVMQYFTYEVARVLGKPIDKPRNLAKSVTVE